MRSGTFFVQIFKIRLWVKSISVFSGSADFSYPSRPKITKYETRYRAYIRAYWYRCPELLYLHTQRELIWTHIGKFRAEGSWSLGHISSPSTRLCPTWKMVQINICYRRAKHHVRTRITQKIYYNAWMAKSVIPLWKIFGHQMDLSNSLFLVDVVPV